MRTHRLVCRHCRHHRHPPSLRDLLRTHSAVPLLSARQPAAVVGNPNRSSSGSVLARLASRLSTRSTWSVRTLSFVESRPTPSSATVTSSCAFRKSSSLAAWVVPSSSRRSKASCLCLRLLPRPRYRYVFKYALVSHALDITLLFFYKYASSSCTHRPLCLRFTFSTPIVTCNGDRLYQSRVRYTCSIRYRYCSCLYASCLLSVSSYNTVLVSKPLLAGSIDVVSLFLFPWTLHARCELLGKNDR